MLKGKTRAVCTYLDLAQLTPILPHPPNYCLALLRLSVFLHPSSSCVKDDPYKDPVTKCRLEGLIWLMQSPLPPSQHEHDSNYAFDSMRPLDYSG